MRVKTLERKIIKVVRDSGSLSLKFVFPGMDGAPDRLVLLPGGEPVDEGRQIW